ncbi:MAG: hypothetical protein M0Z43_09825 [Acidithiobacillus sp.]|nr:hypothetical protein [Acidithiobacillus sp.]
MGKNKGGRPTTYTKERGEIILALIMEGKSLVEITKLEDMPPYRTVCEWLARNQEFSQNYARARDIQADYYFDEIKTIADTPCVEPHDVGWQKNRIDARKWMASKLLPKKYGDKIETEHSGSVQVTHSGVLKVPATVPPEKWGKQ